MIFLVSGLWHGANWTFIAWGAYHAILFLPLILLKKNRKYRDVVASDRVLPNIKEFALMLGTFFLVVVGWVIFRSETIGQSIDYLHGMLQWNTLYAPFAFFFSPDTRGKAFFVTIMLIVEWFNRRKEHGLSLLSCCSWYIRYPAYLMIITFIVWYCGTNQSFIYFQF